MQVLERDCIPEDFQKKRAKIEGKRYKAFVKVPVMIAICMKRRANPDKEMPEWEEMCATACAVQNLWLSATARGLAGVHMCLPVSCFSHEICSSVIGPVHQLHECNASIVCILWQSGE